MAQGDWAHFAGCKPAQYELHEAKQLGNLEGNSRGWKADIAGRERENEADTEGAGLYTLEIDKGITLVPNKFQPTLEEYEAIFAVPKALPPKRPQDHKIPLLLNSKPINSKAYRYSFIQKNEIEEIVKEMLEFEVIQPSNSSFPSPVLLVKRKDGIWRFCLDYRELNSITIKEGIWLFGEEPETCLVVLFGFVYCKLLFPFP